MSRGGHQVIPPSGGFDEEEVFQVVRKMENVSFFAAPTMLHRLVESARGRGKLGSEHYPGLGTIVAGGAPFYVEDIKASVACFGPRIAQMYGQGETPLTATAMNAYHTAKAVESDDDLALASVGFPQTGVELQIWDDEGRQVPAGETGEIVVRAHTVMNGYWRNAEETRKALRDGWLKTGDVGLLDAHGRLHLKDRSKDVIISGGTNIYPREVEDALLKHRAVKEVSVIGVPDAEWGESVMAIIVADRAVSTSELDATCVENIARFKRPKHYLFVESLPKSPNGKVLKTELRKSYGARRNNG
jgi:acyl-CoA synthetase (AMP-forming)/AMP-acid ligase II